MSKRIVFGSAVVIAVLFVSALIGDRMRSKQSPPDATLQLGRAQDGATVRSPGRQVVTENLPCSQDWQDRSALSIKVTDSLVVAVPMKYVRYELLTCGKTTDGVPRDGPQGLTYASFDFFMPDFSGYTPERLRERFDVDEVTVAYVDSVKDIEPDPSHPVAYPSNQLRNMFHLLADPNKYQDMYGLHCFEARILKTTIYCYSADAGENHEGILIDVDVPYGNLTFPNPQMTARYFSKRYDGVEVSWRTNTKNLPHWREIDDQVWKFLADWNVADRKTASQ